MKMVQLLGLWIPWQHKVFRDRDCLRHSVMALSESFFKPLIAGHQKTSLASLFIAPPIQTLRRLPCLVSFSVVRCIRHIDGVPLVGVLLCRSVHQALKGAPWVGSYSVVQCIRRLMG